MSRRAGNSYVQRDVTGAPTSYDLYVKACNNCGTVKDLDGFYANPRGRGGLRPECKDCTKARRKEWYARNSAQEVDRVRRWAVANPDKVAERIAAVRGSEKKKLADRKSHLKRKYGMTLADYDRLFEQQGGVCAICGEPRPEERTLHVDHDHVTGVIRGLLCFRCNNALGDFREQYELFQAAADYLDRDDDLESLVRARVGALTG
jgi:RNA polymerase-binding transcription factor DksA